MSEHTPGPWRVGTSGPNGCPTIGTTKGLMVAMIAHSLNVSNQKAAAESDAALIAAAPELLDVLEEIEHYWICEEPQNARQYLSKKVTDLITKAKGESK